MNLSNSSIRDLQDRDGEPADDRAEYVDELRISRQVGWQNGSPVVGERLELTEDVPTGYQNYKIRKELFLPSSGDFLRDLFDSELITSVDDVSEEINTDVSTIRQACEIHGIDLPGGEEPAPQESDDDVLKLPSGEEWDLELLQDPPETDCRVLTQLLAQDGLSVTETASFLSDRLDTTVRGRDVRQAAEGCNLL